jgi:hypothetical protein
MPRMNTNEATRSRPLSGAAIHSGVSKPYPTFRWLLSRFYFQARRFAFIDDKPKNVRETPIGIRADHLCYAVSLQREHASLRLVPEQSARRVHM